MVLFGEYNSPGSLGGTTLGTKDQALAKVRSLEELAQGGFASYWELTIQPAMEATMSKLSPTVAEGFRKEFRSLTPIRLPQSMRWPASLAK